MSNENNVSNDEAKVKESGNSLLSVAGYTAAVVAVLGLIGTLLSIAGYGISLAAEEMLGMPHAALFKSAFDLLDLSFFFLIQLFNAIAASLSQIFHSKPYWSAVELVPAFCLFTWFVVYGFMKIKEKLKAKFGSIKPFQLHQQSEKKKFLIVSGIVTIGSTIGAMVAMPLVLVIILLVSSVLGIIPVISMGAGEKYIQDYVITPSRCRPFFTREQQLERIKAAGKKKEKDQNTENVAQCVKVLDGDKLIAQGRVVFNTTGAVILYDPKTGKTTREPLDGKTIEVVSTL